METAERLIPWSSSVWGTLHAQLLIPTLSQCTTELIYILIVSANTDVLLLPAVLIAVSVPGRKMVVTTAFLFC